MNGGCDDIFAIATPWRVRRPHTKDMAFGNLSSLFPLRRLHSHTHNSRTDVSFTSFALCSLLLTKEEKEEED